MTTQETVLVFSKRANPAQAAKLHASTCSGVAKAESKPRLFSVVRGAEAVAREVQDLHERIFVVRKCPCCK